MQKGNVPIWVLHWGIFNRVARIGLGHRASNFKGLPEVASGSTPARRDILIRFHRPVLNMYMALWVDHIMHMHMATNTADVTQVPLTVCLASFHNRTDSTLMAQSPLCLLN